ncbi:hypothetical protein GQ600_23984 [Phytophthora cactorum]|nr:hypothetical protein GQ600_23984 [Phytophthora cactorum]
MEAVPNEKGVRAFSLFPVSTSFTNLHIVINGTTLAGFVSRIRDRGQGNLMEDWNMPQVRISTASFKVMRWTVMRRVFVIDRFEIERRIEEKYEHASHLFANEIKTDGYSASVLYYRPKHEELGGEDDSLVPEGYSPDVVIGLDPGIPSMCTAAREYLRLQAPRRRSRRKRARHRNNRDIVSVTTHEYRHLAGFNRFRAWNESQKRKFPDYKIEGMPSFKTSSYEKYLQRLDYFWQHAAFLLRFCLERPYRKWRFFQKRMARVAVDEIARRIVPTVSRLTCVAYGDWSRRDGIKGHASSPVKGLKEALRKRDGGFLGRVQDEQALLAYPTPVFPKGVQKPKRRKLKGKVLPRDWSRAEIKSKHCHVVLRCENEDCEARYWDRDVNAAINSGAIEERGARARAHGAVQAIVDRHKKKSTMTDSAAALVRCVVFGRQGDADLAERDSCERLGGGALLAQELKNNPVQVNERNNELPNQVNQHEQFEAVRTHRDGPEGAHRFNCSSPGTPLRRPFCHSGAPPLRLFISETELKSANPRVRNRSCDKFCRQQGITCCEVAYSVYKGFTREFLKGQAKVEEVGRGKKVWSWMVLDILLWDQFVVVQCPCAKKLETPVVLVGKKSGRRRGLIYLNATFFEESWREVLVYLQPLARGGFYIWSTVERT